MRICGFVCKFALGCGQVKFLWGIWLYKNRFSWSVDGILNLKIRQLSVSDTTVLFKDFLNGCAFLEGVIPQWVCYPGRACNSQVGVFPKRVGSRKRINFTEVSYPKNFGLAVWWYLKVIDSTVICI